MPTAPHRNPVAVVTGGSGNLGQAIALSLARDGFDVAVTYRTGESSAQRTTASVKRQGMNSVALACDVTRTASVSRLPTLVTEALGPVAVLVNNAGTIRDKKLTNITEDDWRSVMSVNTDGAYRTVRAFAPDLEASGASAAVINISSIATDGQPGQIGYATSKAALEGFTRALAREMARHKVRVNAVAPGFVATDFTSQYAAAWSDRIPLGRFAEPSEVADLVTFLASSRARYLTGQVIRLDGGLRL